MQRKYKKKKKIPGLKYLMKLFPNQKLKKE